MAATPDSSFIFAASGNGPFDGKTTFGDSILKLAPRSLQVLDFFTPFDQVADQQGDQDVGSGGVVLLPTMTDARGVSRTLGVIAGKDKKTYLFDQSNLGKITANNSTLYQPIGPAFANPIFGPSAFFNGALCFGPRAGAIVKFVFSQAKLSTMAQVQQLA